MSRHRIPNTDSTLVQALLLPELEEHARQRATYFFLYLFHLRFLVDYVNSRHTPLRPLDPMDGYASKSTDQANRGFRRPRQSRFREFDKATPDLRKATAAGFTKTDAAHFCNLGVKAQFAAEVSKYLADRTVFDVFTLLKNYICSDTTHLPQAVNLGPDKIIDTLHADLAVRFFKDGAQKLITKGRIGTYRNLAVDRMSEYAADQTDEGNLGLQACAAQYLEAYNNPEFVGTIYSRMLSAVTSRCKAGGMLAPESYIGWS